MMLARRLPVICPLRLRGVALLLRKREGVRKAVAGGGEKPAQRLPRRAAGARKPGKKRDLPHSRMISCLTANAG